MRWVERRHNGGGGGREAEGFEEENSVLWILGAENTGAIGAGIKIQDLEEPRIGGVHKD